MTHLEVKFWKKSCKAGQVNEWANSSRGKIVSERVKQPLSLNAMEKGIGDIAAPVAETFANQ
jgi:hypothetical protein